MHLLTKMKSIELQLVGFFSLSDFGHGLMSYLKQCAPKKRSNGLIRILIGVQRIELRHDGLFKNDGKNHI